jgi:hypothetical protein
MRMAVAAQATRSMAWESVGPGVDREGLISFMAAARPGWRRRRRG